MAEGQANDKKFNVFISYSRADLKFADEVVAGLEVTGFAPTIDRHDIVEGEEWQKRLGALIADADTVVFAISPDSAKSEMCHWEVGEATRLSKRILPVLWRAPAPHPVPKQLAALHYTRFDEGHSFMAGLKALTSSLNTDLDWLREHTRLLQRASEWDAGGRPVNRLLSGNDIQVAKDWIASRSRNAPEPTPLHLDYVRASETAELERANAERQRLEEVARIQADREEALQERALAGRRLVRRTTIGMLVAFVLAAAATAAGIFAWKNQILAEAERKRAEKNFAAFRNAVTLGRSAAIVPVFYATDRARLEEGVRLAYGAVRANRLETGKALVTVPHVGKFGRIARPPKASVFDITIYQGKEDPSKHFTLQDVTPLKQKEFSNDARRWVAEAGRDKGHAIVFVPGFNVAFDNALYRTANLAYDLRFSGPVFVYSWPSTGSLRGYLKDRESAMQSVPYLKAFLETIVKRSGAAKVSILAYSLGAAPLIEVLQKLNAHPGESPRFEQVMFVTPDVDRAVFANMAGRAVRLARRITLYVSNQDRSIQLSSAITGIPRAGNIGLGGPLIVKGVDTIDLSAVGTETVGASHSAYASRDPLLEDIEKLLRSGASPAMRSPTLQPVETAKGRYWRYTGEVQR